MPQIHNNLTLKDSNQETLSPGCYSHIADKCFTGRQNGHIGVPKRETVIMSVFQTNPLGMLLQFLLFWLENGC